MAFCEAGKARLGKVFTYFVTTISWIVNFTIINIMLVLFRADSVTQWIQILKRFTVMNLDIRSELIEPFRIPKFKYVLQFLHLPSADNDVLLTGCILAQLTALIICLCFKNNYEREYKTNTLSLVFTGVLLVACIFSMSSISAFLYFNF